MKKKFKENNCLFSEQWHLVSDFCPTTEEDVTFVTDDGKLQVDTMRGLVNSPILKEQQFL